ncbi:uncharacterized protein LOC105665464 [Ceratitis capitata]|uniref:uncharacterized protein LOC105665464 n=1 Tax=Ceratitis capitata TaxID=7213 RepID=UPI0006188E49|nr:uncharacterized protein LOC105665464 [Ceratitis capitata]
MPLVKIIGAQPTTSTAAAVAIEVATFTRNQSLPPEPPPSKPKFPQPRQEQKEEIKFWGKVPLWKDKTPEGVLAARKIHTDFLIEVHMHALFYLILAIIEWIMLYKIAAVVSFVRRHYCLALVPFACSFTMLVTLVFFYDLITKDRHKAVFYIYTFIMLQLSTIAVAMPISSSVFSQLLFSGIISAIVIIGSIVVAQSRKDFYIYKPRFIFAWTCRCFLVASMGIIVGISLKSPHFDVVMTLTMLFFMSVYILMCGRAISRAEFIWMDTYGPHMYGTLFYMNYMTLYSMGVLLFVEIHEVGKL